MDATIYLHYISVLFMVIIAFSGLMMAFSEKRKFGWGIFVAFALFAFYEIVGLTPPFGITEEVLSIVFFAATLAMLMTVLSIALEKTKKKSSVQKQSKPAEKASPKKTTSKGVAKKTSAKKTSSAPNTTSKKTSAKKASSKKAATKKATTAKSAVKSATKSAAKKTTTKRRGRPRKSAAKKK